ncbi:hypothetical protein [Frankia sp. AvcI1]|uniref:hypothetical protein n=1 Tax=Frankia sp. AvcI1 TaxID=573496 RepID=UPI002117786E|nr:hypothetical protein [Frankia sp. AvcI1]
MTTAARARARSIAIAVFGTIAIVALVLSLRANATQSSVAQREARRVAVELEEQQRASCAFWRHLGAFEAWEAGSEIGRTLVTDARATANDLGCPP